MAEQAAPSGATRRMVKIGPGEHYVTAGDETIITVLGSCVAACIRDPLARVAGMNHFMLPESATGSWGAASAKFRYGNFAMERLINEILRRGGRRSRLEIKVFGGAAMIAGGVVGHQNADFVESYLKAERLPIEARHLRGRWARRIEYQPLSGAVRMLELRNGTASVTTAEAAFRSTLQESPVEGSIELFD
jgi:chemotaxis protein CheD